MTASEAKVILQFYLDRKNTVFEDDNGKIVTGWRYIIGDQVMEILSEQSGEPMPLDEGSVGFMAYLVPPDIKDVSGMTEDDRDEYGELWCIAENGNVYVPEA